MSVGKFDPVQDKEINKFYVIQDEDIFQEFCENRGLSEGSIRFYRTALQRYSDYTKKGLEDLIQEAEEEEDNRIRMRNRKIRSYLNGFRKHLDDEELSLNYINQVVSAVRSFYGDFEIELPKIFRRKSRKDKKQEEFDDIPTMEDVKRSLDYSSLTYRALTLLMVSSGMSRSEICSLTFKDFYNAVDLPEDFNKPIPELIEKIKEMDSLIPMWKIHRVKTGKPYFTFNSPEATDHILDYLEQHYRKYNWQPKPEDQLFRQYNKQINPNSVTIQYNRINERAGFKKVNGRIYIRPHNLRKLFATTLEMNRMPHLMTRFIMGHTIDKTSNAYFKMDPEVVKEEYIEIVDKLSTSKVEVKIVRTGYDGVKSELEDMRLKQALYERQMEALQEDKGLKSKD